MRRAVPMLLGLGCVLTLVLVCFHSVLFRGHQFAYRDTGHFYYPLYRVVQQEWAAGRWPLWNPWQNGGTPLLGMPMAAVLYPGKLLYAALPYALAARYYIIAHTILALLGMLALGRSLGLSGTGSSLAAISYAFGAPVLSQSSNVIFLVGAAWLPWGFRAIHRLVILRNRGGLIELSTVLAMQILGGDPEAAYLTAAVGVLYAFVLVSGRDNPSRETPGRRPQFLRLSLIVILGWSAVVLAAGYLVPRGWGETWLAPVRILGPLIGLSLAILLAWRLPRPNTRPGLPSMLVSLAGASLLAVAITAVQIIPSWEFANQSTRMTGPSDSSRYDFSLEPYRLIEFLWPNVFGLEIPENASWIQAIAPANERMIWSHSHYVGAMVILLAIGAAGFGLADLPWRSWLTIVAMIGLLGAMGKFAGPLWWLRGIPGTADLIGPHDPGGGLDRPDAFLSDGTGSVYGIMATLLPGFGLFRYPSKLIILACVAISILAGLGWDRLCLAAIPSTPTRRRCLAALMASAALASGILASRSAIERWLDRYVPPSSLFGPVDAMSAVNMTLWALIQCGTVCILTAMLATWASRHPRWAGPGALILLTADLALASRQIIWTVPQADLDGTPRVARLIDDAERSDPSPDPFRIHRVERWHPREFLERRSPNRLSELVAWEHETLDRLHAQPSQLAYTMIRGVIDIEDYLDFFEAQSTWGKDEHGIGRPIYAFPRGGYDLWAARYFVMPVSLNGWMGPERGFMRIAPADEVVADPERAQQWIAREGWQLLRNRQAMPRCWVVQSAVVIPPTAARSGERAELVRTLINANGATTTDRKTGPIDWRRSAFVETDDPAPLASLRVRPTVEPTGAVTIARAAPQRIELRANLQRPGLVILADLFYPGWYLTIDGVPAPIWRTNRMMRGALVPAGSHTLVYTYRPDSFRLGAVVSAAALIVLGVLIVWAGSGHRIDRASPI